MKKALLTIAALASLAYGISSESRAIKQVPVQDHSIKQALKDPKRTMLPVITFHRVREKPKAYTEVTPERTREVFNYLYTNGFYLTPLDAVVDKKINIPSDKKPVVLTWDDTLLNKLLVKEYITFTRLHPDFGRSATVFVSSPNKYLGLTKERLEQVVNFYKAHGIDIQPHGTYHKYLDDATREEAEKEALPINSKLELLSLNPRYYALPGGNAPNKKETRKFFEEKFSATLLCNGGLHNMNRRGEYIQRIDVVHFEDLKRRLKKNDERLYIQP